MTPESVPDRPAPRGTPSLHDCLRRDRARLSRLRKSGRKRDFESLHARSAALRQTRSKGVPALDFDHALPILDRKTEIQQAIRDHQVVVVCGETGSGKSTQLPKFCLEMGYGIDGFIGHTQPRRVAARAIAARLAHEMGSEVGGHAGYKFRFAEEVGEQTYIKVMTDGMLLAEIETDRRLEQYDVLIIDEAHERSLNIDFLLGILKRLLPRRPDFRVIVTSATIDPYTFSRFFDEAPVIEVSGRTYPVEIRYRPFDQGSADSGERNLEVALLHAADELIRQGPGDILVFLPGEFHIRKTAELLRRRHYPQTEILPLYARLSERDQRRVFEPGGGRRIILATNVAETSITVPGIRYVIDSGLARISRYRPARQLQALPIEPVSQASAQQRAGRCGREADGVCIRLYSEEDFESRAMFTEPEIQRTSLASVILSMFNLRLGSIDEFPFMAPPPAKMVKAGYRLLEELGAIDDRRGLTPTGRGLARIPADPRIGRMLLAAGEHHCASEVLVIAAALSIQDPRDYPAEAREAARQAHAAHRHDKSDFLGYLELWERYRRETRDLSRRQRTRYCRERFLSAVRMREWRNVRDQLRHIARELNIRLNSEPATEETVHKALLTGLLGNIAHKQDDEYLGTQGKKFHIHPGSALFKSRPAWLMSAELVQTRRLYARTVAAIDPAWVEHAAGHLIRRQYLDPWWDTRRQEVMAREQLTLFGLTVVSGRKVSYGRIAPGESRGIFIRQGLVTGNFDPLPEFVHHNLDTVRQVEDIEHRLRRRGIAIDEEQLFEFYDRRLPPGIRDPRSLRHWIRTATEDQRQALQLDPETARAGTPVADYPERFPEYLEVNDNRLPLRYRFEPGHPVDGVTLRVPLPLARQLDESTLSWVVPGLLIEKMTALVRTLPKPQRRGLGPANDAALLCLEHMAAQDDESLTRCMSRTFREQRGVEIPAADWDESSLPGHLRMNIEVVDGDGNILDHDRDLPALLRRTAESGVRASARAPGIPDWVRGDLTDWSFGDLPEVVEHDHAGVRLRSFVALADRGERVAIELYDSEGAARQAMPAGLSRLLKLQLGGRLKYLRKNLPQARRMCLNFAAVGSFDALIEDILGAAVGSLLPADPWWLRSRDGFDELLAAAGEQVVPAATTICEQVAPALERFRDCMGRLDSVPAGTRTDIAQQLDLLVFPGFVTHTPRGQFEHFDRYLHAVQKRIDRCHHNPRQDAERIGKIAPFWGRLLTAHPPPPDPVEPALADFRWMLEEYRVSVFAQELGTAQPVSNKRLEAQWQKFQTSINGS